jgi:hypothetical protein
MRQGPLAVVLHSASVVHVDIEVTGLVAAGWRWSLGAPPAPSVGEAQNSKHAREGSLAIPCEVDTAQGRGAVWQRVLARVSGRRHLAGA